eukprot:9399913-Alexandrium_andersonii.AAC.1
MESDSPSADTSAQEGAVGEMSGRSTQPSELSHAAVRRALAEGFGEHRLRWACKQKEPACPQPPSSSFRQFQAFSGSFGQLRAASG